MSSKRQPSDDLIDTTIGGRYRIISRLGAGGMGTAYRAWDERDGIPVVIKIPRTLFFEDPQFAERFRREITLLQGLAHRHVVPITDVGDHNGLPFVAMRFLPGGSLSNRRLRDDGGKVRPNPPGFLHLWLPAIAEALDYVHSQGVVHRDVKPANIFFDAFWGAYLGDFGISKVIEESDSFDKEHTLTATHMGIGTQEYMGPEQFMPKAVIDGRADQYALAVIVYELLVGTRPFTGATAHLVVEVTTQPVPSLEESRSDLPISLADAVHRGLAKQPVERFTTCRAFAAAVLRDVTPLDDEPAVARLLCPKCSTILKLPLQAAGRRGMCPRCDTGMKVANDLGALWLLDEARRQRKASATATATAKSEEVDSDADAALETPMGETLAMFEPIAEPTPARTLYRKRRMAATRYPGHAGSNATGISWIFVAVGLLIAAVLASMVLTSKRPKKTKKVNAQNFPVTPSTEPFASSRAKPKGRWGYSTQSPQADQPIAGGLDAVLKGAASPAADAPAAEPVSPDAGGDSVQ